MSWQDMGPVAWPLAICSLLVVALVLDRLWVLLSLQPVSARAVAAALAACRQCEGRGCRMSPHAGVSLLLAHRDLAVSQREELMACWLHQEQQRLTRHLRLLQLIGVIAPMLGLLGTVLGLVVMFADIARVTQPVTPALLAAGLWQALHTTLWGLLIGILALAAGQGFSLWADQYLGRVEHALNRCQLALAGLDADAVMRPAQRSWRREAA